MYRRNYYRGRSGKYSNETVCINCTSTDLLTAGGSFPYNEHPTPGTGEIKAGCLVVPSTVLQGTRKAKNFTLKLVARGNESPIVGVMVYVPEGTEASTLGTQLAAQSLYEPNQNVICSFIIPPSCDRTSAGFVNASFTPPTVTVSSRLARNLSSGDSIVIVFCPVDDINAGDGTADPDSGLTHDPLVITGTVNFAIKY